MTKHFFLIWLAGIPGVAAISWLVLPLLLEGRPLPAPQSVISITSAVQSALLLALAAWTGAKLASQVGLHAPVLQAAADGRLDMDGLRSQLLPGVIGGVLGAAILVAFARFAPEQLASLQERFSFPLVARVLYGGITEEILVRWGLMTAMVWIGWRLFQGGAGTPSALIVWLPILLSALAFGALHLPVVAAMLGPLPASLSAYIVLANAAFGIVAGFLFWRYGLEAAMLAHVIAHLGAFAFTR
ncbi:MAG TPA: CPBP family intramembrane glutamic endopeptidase [Noviherbaspirillum sp.]|uniref:CPBP family intramembrane glutamic endopeptidase n=1 Tax=Noviherbaspirillum sp. TaxID=1926288 RepID=UPI002D617764|nr:CPBP family intramembrane glutamic endopeptidase [Noviherbaspirillum sp.]HYD94476.1 CPBP family intramembrane glutamic endopeptidase [Noviherbaspirillum sp.]